MKTKVSDYIADFLAEKGIVDCFTVTGGSAMHLNDSFGHHEIIRCTYFHHEQAAAIAAEAYARINNNIATVCVSTGPGATNAITGVLCGWMGSIPMLVISGQARYATTVRFSGLNLRTRGVQEFDITGTVHNMTKYCEMITDPLKIRYALEKALHLAKENRPGPCWLDIPLDIQSAIIETDDLEPYYNESEHKGISGEVLGEIINRIKNAERPVLFAGNGIRFSGAHKQFIELIDKLNIPVVTGVSSVDAIASDHVLYAGRSGITGDRAGNFAIQNSDLVLSIGSRLSFLQTGFNYESWARNAYKIICDIDDEELEKDSIGANLKLCCDAKELIEAIILSLSEPLESKEAWISQCRRWRERYPVVMEKHETDARPNIYVFFNKLTKVLTQDECIVVGVGTSRVAGSQASFINEGVRFITNPSAAPMGYCLPAAIGACIARGKRKTYLVTGDGSLQMNLQELQTIVHNKFPICIFVMNNDGYHSIRITQKTYFRDDLVGIGPDSKDLSFPDLSKIATAYGLEYRRCCYMDGMEDSINWAIQNETACICELLLSTEYVTEPKATSKKMPDGRMVSVSLEDMAPFLEREELSENMLIPMVQG